MSAHQLKFLKSTASFAFNDSELGQERLPTVFWVYSPFLYHSEVLPLIVGYKAEPFHCCSHLQDFIDACALRIQSERDTMSAHAMNTWKKLHTNAWSALGPPVRVNSITKEDFMELFECLACYTAQRLTPRIIEDSKALLKDVLGHYAVNANVGVDDCGFAYWSGHAWLECVQALAKKCDLQKTPWQLPVTAQESTLRHSPIRLSMGDSHNKWDGDFGVLLSADPEADDDGWDMCFKLKRSGEKQRLAQDISRIVERSILSGKTVHLSFDASLSQVAYMFCLLYSFQYHREASSSYPVRWNVDLVNNVRHDFVAMVREANEGLVEGHYVGCPLHDTDIRVKKSACRTWAEKLNAFIQKNASKKLTASNVMLAPNQNACICPKQLLRA